MLHTLRSGSSVCQDSDQNRDTICCSSGPHASVCCDSIRPRAGCVAWEECDALTTLIKQHLEGHSCRRCGALWWRSSHWAAILVTSNSSPAGPFSPGATIDAPPIGDFERQAVASLRGYAYQVAAATLAWLDLDESGKLYLEVAEDYATLAKQTLAATQVKDTAGSGSITLNTQAIRDAVDSFVRLTDGNKGRDVQLRYLTTSPIGTEHAVADRPAGEPGLAYWQRAAGGADVTPLRVILAGDTFSDSVKAFVKCRDDQQLRNDLLRKIFWDSEQLDLAGITQEIEEKACRSCARQIQNSCFRGAAASKRSGLRRAQEERSRKCSRSRSDAGGALYSNRRRDAGQHATG